MTKQFDAIWVNAQVVTCENEYGLIEHAGIAVKDGKIAWVGPMEMLSTPPEELANTVHDVKGLCITPGFIDSHTHLIYAGNRANEFEQRLQGVSYEQIAREGGGIRSTVKATRSASEDELCEQSLSRARALMESGVTTLEIKSGYGLNWETEKKILRVAEMLEKILPVTIRKTFLGAHSLPIEYHDDADAYIDLVCNQMIPEVANESLADSVDVFCEKIAFNLEQTEKVFKAANLHHLNVKCHAEQLSCSESAILAAKYKALSVDHLEHLSLDGIEAMVKSKTVAVLLPGAFYFLRDTKHPPIDALRQHNIPIAVASDCNPGTSPVLSIQIILNMACTVFRLTPEEAILGVTCHAAKALGLDKTHGTLTVGKVADLAIWKVKHPAELAYYIGGNFLHTLVKNGNIIKI